MPTIGGSGEHDRRGSMTQHTRRFQDSPEGFERYTYTRTRLMEECNYRRNRQWSVVTWASTLLLAVMGGVVTLWSTDNPISVQHAWVLTCVVVLCACFCVTWITHDAGVAQYYSDRCWEADDEFGLKYDDRSHKKRHYVRNPF